MLVAAEIPSSLALNIPHFHNLPLVANKKSSRLNNKKSKETLIGNSAKLLSEVMPKIIISIIVLLLKTIETSTFLKAFSLAAT